MDLTEKVKMSSNDSKSVIVGHSLGGGVASADVVVSGIKGGYVQCLRAFIQKRQHAKAESSALC